MKLIDTSAWIEYLRGPRHPLHFEVKELLHQREAAWCGIVALELANYGPFNQQAGIERIHRVAWMVETDLSVWRKACTLSTAARRSGVTAPMADLVVFTCSKLYDLGVVHKGDTDFGRLETVYRTL